MASGLPGRKLPAMTFRSLQIALSVEVDGDVVRGHADDGSGPARPFSGWIGLIATLDALLEDRTLPAPTDTKPE
jgi:hypothetical protein